MAEDYSDTPMQARIANMVYDELCKVAKQFKHLDADDMEDEMLAMTFEGAEDSEAAAEYRKMSGRDSLQICRDAMAAYRF